MLRTPLGDRVLVAQEGELFAEAVVSMLDFEIGMGEANPGWDPVFLKLTHEQKVFLLNCMTRAALSPTAPIPQFTAETDAALSAVYDQAHINIEIELDNAREALANGSLEDGHLAWRRMVLDAAKGSHLAEMFGGFVEPDAVTDEIRANNADDRYDRIPIWPKDTCDDLTEWDSIIDLLRAAVLFDSDWRLEDTMLDLPRSAASKTSKQLTIPADYFGQISPDPVPEQARSIFEEMTLFLWQYLGTDNLSRKDIRYNGPAKDGDSE